MPSLPTTDVPEDMLMAVIQEAAEQTGVSPGDLVVVAAEAVTWSDGSLGCPEAGMAYTQALVPGYRVVIDAGGEELHFHAGQTGDFRYCQDPQPPAETGGSDR